MNFNKAEQLRRAAEFEADQAAQGKVAPVIAQPVATPKPTKVPRDFKGVELRVGDSVARAVINGRTPLIEICEVTRVDGMKVYLNGSPQALHYPARVLILSK